jgi:hypothetical protein
MYPEYSPERQALTADARDVMRFTLERRTAQGALDAEAWKSLAERWRREPSPWIAAERDAALAGVPSVAANPVPQTVPAATTVSVSALKASEPAPPVQTLPSVVIPELSEKEQKLFDEARAKKAAGDLIGARQLALPLFTAYPQVEAIQEFRCQIAMERGGSISAWKAECDPLLKLGPNRSGKR